MTHYFVSPDGTRVVFRADQVFDEEFELFSAPLDGSAAPVRLHDPFPDGSPKDVGSFAIGSGGRVVFQGNLIAGSRVELFSAPLDGSASPLNLSGALVSGGNVESFQLTPDGMRAVFLADKLADGRPELFSVPVDGSSAPLRLDPFNRAVSRIPAVYRISHDSSFVLYTTSGGNKERLQRVPIDASQAPLQIADSGNPQLLETYFVELKIAADDLHAAFVRVDEFLDRGDVHRYGLFGLLLDGSQPPAQLHIQESLDGFPDFEPIGNRVVYTEPDGACYTIVGDASGRVQLGSEVSEFTIAPDQSRVAFVSGSGSAGRLYVAPVDGGSPPTALAGPAALESPRWTPDSSRVVFIATTPSPFRGLFEIPASGGTPLLLNGPALPERGVQDFSIGPYGLTIVYREDRAADEVLELFSVDASLMPRKLSGALDGFRDVIDFAFAPDGGRVVYLADQNLDATDELFGAPSDASAPPIQYNEPLPGGPVLGDVFGYQVTQDGARVVYLADQDVDGFNDLFATRTDGRGTPVRITAPLSDVGSVYLDFLLTPSGDRVVGRFFNYSGYPNLITQLFSTATSGQEPLVVLDSSNGSYGGFQFPVAVDASESIVVYRKVVYGTGWRTLHSAELDGSQPPVTLVELTGVNQTVGEAQVTADGLAVIYTANPDDVSEMELFRMPSDGSGPALQLNPTLVPGGDVLAIRLTPDSSRVIYRAHQEVFGRFELFSVLSNGSALAHKLNGTPVIGGNVEEFVITADSAHVVYRADQTINNAFELYSARSDAVGTALRLTPLLGGRSVEADFKLSADGLRVCYRADAVTKDQFELFAVPLDGSTTPLQLSAALVAGGNVTSFALSADGTRAVYLADQRTDEVFELFSVPTSGGPAVLLTDLPPTADVTAFAIDPGSQWVAYVADANTNGKFELFRVPLDGSAPPERLNRSLPTAGDVEPDIVALSGGRVLYRADQDRNDVVELFSFVGPGRPFRPGPTPTRHVRR